MAPKPKARPSRAKKKKVKIRVGKILFDLLLAFLAFTILPVLLYGVANPPTTPLLWIRWVQSDFEIDRVRFFNYWTPIEDISPHLVRAVIAAEDQKFFSHRGFDWVAVESAYKHNQTSKKKIGASTISMQTARNAFLWQGRNWLRKGMEAYFTVLIETFWSKKRILEVYLNIIEWGDGVFGCTEAAQKYFKQTPGKLSQVESAWLAAVLPNPRKWATGKYAVGRVKGRQSRILDAMHTIRLPEN